MRPEIKAFQRATNITETYNAVNPEQPLLPGDPRYVDCAPWRGDEHIVNMIARRISRAEAATPVQHLKQLVAGHRGCGKSTELLLLASIIHKPVKRAKRAEALTRIVRDKQVKLFEG